MCTWITVAAASVEEPYENRTLYISPIDIICYVANIKVNEMEYITLIELNLKKILRNDKSLNRGLTSTNASFLLASPSHIQLALLSRLGFLSLTLYLRQHMSLI